MSHFTVSVITETNNIDEVDNLLAPYNEDIENFPKKDLMFHNTTKENKKDWRTKTISMVRLKNDRLVRDTDNMFRVEKKNDRGLVIEVNYVIPEDSVKVEVPRKVIYPTFDDYMVNYCGEKKDKTARAYGYWTNPKAKWDWYSVGGRWFNMLLVKKTTKSGQQRLKEIDKAWKTYHKEMANTIDGRKHIYEPKIKEAPEGYVWVNSAKIGEVEFDLMLKDEYNKAFRFWELKVEGQKPANKDEEEILEWDWFRTEYYTERYKDKEEYATYQSMFATYALLDKDNWYSKGEMGWFGFDDSTGQSEKDFLDFLNSYIKNPDNQDKYITIVDCHI